MYINPLNNYFHIPINSFHTLPLKTFLRGLKFTKMGCASGTPLYTAFILIIYVPFKVPVKQTKFFYYFDKAYYEESRLFASNTKTYCVLFCDFDWV